MGAVWTLEDAEKSLSAVVEAARSGDPQRVAISADEAVVVVSAREFDLMSQRPKTFIEHLMSFPKLPEGMDDLFDDRDQYPSEYRDIDLGD